MRSVLQMGLTAMVAFLFSCSGQKEAPTASQGAGKILALDEGAGQLALEKKFADFRKDVVLDDKGRIQKDSKRSSLEGRQFSNGGNSFGDKKFAASRYSKKNWQGSKDYNPGNYQTTKNRWDNDEWFVRKQAQEAGLAARSQGTNYSTSGYNTAAAREQAGQRLNYSTDVQTDKRREVFIPPTVIGKEDYEKMTIEESKNILGR